MLRGLYVFLAASYLFMLTCYSLGLFVPSQVFISFTMLTVSIMFFNEAIKLKS